MNQASRIAWYKQQVPRAKEGKMHAELTPELQLRALMHDVKHKEIFPELVVADIGRLVWIALGDLCDNEDGLFDLYEEAKTILAGPDLGAVETHYTRRRLAIGVAEMSANT